MNFTEKIYTFYGKMLLSERATFFMLPAECTQKFMFGGYPLPGLYSYLRVCVLKNVICIAPGQSNIQCDAIRWKQFLRRCRLGQL